MEGLVEPVNLQKRLARRKSRHRHSFHGSYLTSMADDSTIKSLREALSISPDNVALRKLLGRTLIQQGQTSEAEAEFRKLVEMRPDDNEARLDLANAFFQQGKFSPALVIVEDMVAKRGTPAGAHLLHARLLMQRSETSFAITEYRHAIAEDAALRDTALEAELGIEAPTNSPVSEGRVRAPWEGEDESAKTQRTDFERPLVKFNDVGGMANLKEEIRMKVIYPIQHADMFKAYGKAIGGGILMYGPPGCGKTHLARATAGEISAGFLNIGIHDVLDMWIGSSEKALHALFQTARTNKPCVMFFDEVDALGASRADMKTSGGRHLINQFLTETDSVASSNEGVLILAATNAPWNLDPAFRRPGRFDRIIFVPPPDREGRAEILRLLLKGKPSGTIDHDAIAKKTEEFSGADLKAVVDVCVEAKLQEAMKTGRPLPIETRDLLAAAKQVQPSTRDWFSSARNYALYSNQGGQYDEILKYLKLSR